MVTFYVETIITTCWAIIGHLFDTIFKDTNESVKLSIYQRISVKKQFWATQVKTSAILDFNNSHKIQICCEKSEII